MPYLGDSDKARPGCASTPVPKGRSRNRQAKARQVVPKDELMEASDDDEASFEDDDDDRHQDQAGNIHSYNDVMNTTIQEHLGYMQNDYYQHVEDMDIPGIGWHSAAGMDWLELDTYSPAALRKIRCTCNQQT